MEQWRVGHEIRIMAEVGGGLPLWDEEGHLPEEHEFVVDYLGLDEELVAEMLTWANQYDEHAIQDRDEWSAQGEQLKSRVAKTLGPDFSVILILPTWSDEPHPRSASSG